MPKTNQTQKRNNIIAVPFDADFFFERGLRHLARRNFQRALKYFQRCVQCDPHHPQYLIHLAAVYTELEQYDQSNYWLFKVINEVDNTIHECYYYLANNFAHMGDMEQAEHYVLTYLKQEPDGAYSEEAEELLDYICFELERAPKELDEEYRMIEQHEQARLCLEQGKFVEATKILEEMVATYPSFLAARNNLALSYYYLGEWEKALATIDSILEEDASNLHALCNLAVFLTHQEEHDRAQAIINGLKKVLPIHLDHHYKLATTLGILGEDERSFELFSILSRRGLQDEVILYHYLAVAAFNTKRWETAEAAWKKVQTLDPKGEVADYYLELMKRPEIKHSGRRLPYHYQLPYAEQWRKNKWFANGRLPQSVMNDPMIRSSIFWALKHGDVKTKIQVIQSLPLFADQEVEEALKSLLQDPQETDYLKALALFVLRQMGVAIEHEATDNVRWIGHWRKVADCLDQHMTCPGDEQYLQEAYLIWTHFLRLSYPRLPIIKKPEAWAAAVEYVVLSLNNHPCLKKEMAHKYGVSVSTLSRNVELLQQSISLDSVGKKD
ncbi:tetratricopeptide (TPR) repeat protein [Caldalkalibacillus uzonensis]|uniref:Tetratricopeptide (TPR) repeat protein n=1 Tax=Caldalkalibacillus uzonensis TaxID=353224 RepID=A0ABU0CQ17_9BACI|nr:tetratricopeptide repeat protein [Caldalkalibacillus uzonensis]MDQ0338486.1 tetratricopeptide (TPR) repeat protein [Caldalkalibacillus uzonensis]